LQLDSKVYSAFCRQIELEQHCPFPVKCNCSLFQRPSSIHWPKFAIQPTFHVLGGSATISNQILSSRHWQCLLQFFDYSLCPYIQHQGQEFYQAAGPTDLHCTLVSTFAISNSTSLNATRSPKDSPSLHSVALNIYSLCLLKLEGKRQIAIYITFKRNRRNQS
ncbi:hypothetical protein T12_1221, partial [Trichinella patagoniensis]